MTGAPPRRRYRRLPTLADVALACALPLWAYLLACLAGARRSSGWSP